MSYKLSSLFSLNTQKLIFIFTSLIFWFLLDCGYRYFVVIKYEYAGFYLHFTIKYLEAFAIFLFLIFCSPKILNRPSDFFIVIILFGFISPLLIFYGLSNQNRFYLYIVLIGYIVIDLTRKGKPLKLQIISNTKDIIFYLIILGALFVSVWFIITAGFSNLNFNFNEVYKFRDETTIIVDVGFMSYLNIWAYKVFGPILLTISLWKKKYFWMIIIILLHLFWFGVSNHKIILFSPILIIFLYFLFSYNKSFLIIPLSLSLLISLCLLFFYLFEEVWMSNLIIRRSFFVPSFLTFTYYEFFSMHGFIYWSNSITSKLINYPFQLDPPNLIGSYLGTQAHANNSFFATGYMHAGYLGVIFYSVITGFLFKIVDSISNKNLPVLFVVSSLIIPVYSLITSADLPTALLTHGIILSIVFLFFFRSKKYIANIN